jgi:hypothetical protein
VAPGERQDVTALSRPVEAGTATGQGARVLCWPDAPAQPLDPEDEDDELAGGGFPWR